MEKKIFNKLLLSALLILLFIIIFNCNSTEQFDPTGSPATSNASAPSTGNVSANAPSTSNSDTRGNQSDIINAPSTENMVVVVNKEGDLDSLDITKYEEIMCPKGTIALWNNPILPRPKGNARVWVWCNGNNGEKINGITIPDLRGRFPIMVNPGPNSDVEQKSPNPIGEVSGIGGERVHQLSVKEMPRHRHDIPGEITGSSKYVPQCDRTYGEYYKDQLFYGGRYFYSKPEGGRTNDAAGTIIYDPATQKDVLHEGGCKPHNNLPPYYSIGFIIKVL